MPKWSPRVPKWSPEVPHKANKTPNCTPRVPKWRPRCHNGIPRSPRVPKRRHKGPQSATETPKRAPRCRNQTKHTKTQTTNQPDKQRETQISKQPHSVFCVNFNKQILKVALRHQIVPHRGFEVKAESNHFELPRKNLPRPGARRRRRRSAAPR